MGTFGTGIVHVKQAGERTVLEAAQERIATIFDQADTVLVNFSGGKDSTIVLNLCLMEAQKRGRILDVLLCDEEIVDPDTEAFWHRTASRPGLRFWWVCVPIRHTLRGRGRDCWYTWDPDAQDVWFRPRPSQAITAISGYTPGGHIGDVVAALFADRDRFGTVYQTVGVRAQESINRQRTFLVSGSYIVHRLTWLYYTKPIYDWNTPDVWKAIREFGWDYTRLYDKLQRQGRALHHQRLGPWGNVAAARETAQWAEFYPDAWERAIQRLPELKGMARYGQTKLYRQGIAKPDGMTWRDWTLHLIEQYEDEATGAFNRKLVRLALKKWRYYSSVPLPEEPVAGMERFCWKNLAFIVSKNDRIQGNHRDRI